MTNPSRDNKVINARLSVRVAEQALESKPSPQAALDVQRARLAWKSLSHLSLIKD